MREFWLVLVVVLLVGCKGEPSPQNNNTIVINVAELPDDDILATNGEPDSCEFIPLETNENALLQCIDEVVITDSIIVVHEAFALNLYLFDRNGKYINKISGGRAPGEPQTLRVWYVDTVQGRLSNLDLYTGSWYHYTLSGEHIETLPMSDSLYKVLKPECIADIRPIDSEYFLVVYSDYPDIEYKYYVLSRKDMSVVDSFVKQRDWKYLRFQNNTSSIVGADRLLVCSPAYDTVYTLNSDNQVVPKYSVNGVRKPVTPEVYKKITESIDIESDPFPFFKLNYSLGVSSVAATKNHVCIYINGLDQDVYAIMGDLSTNRFSKRLLGNRLTQLSYYPDLLLSATDNGFLGIVSPMELINEKDSPFVQGHSQLRDICKTLKEDDNPIIGIYYVKK